MFTLCGFYSGVQIFFKLLKNMSVGGPAEIYWLCLCVCVHVDKQWTCISSVVYSQLLSSDHMWLWPGLSTYWMWVREWVPLNGTNIANIMIRAIVNLEPMLKNWVWAGNAPGHKSNRTVANMWSVWSVCHRNSYGSLKWKRQGNIWRSLVQWGLVLQRFYSVTLWHLVRVNL